MKKNIIIFILTCGLWCSGKGAVGLEEEGGCPKQKLVVDRKQMLLFDMRGWSGGTRSCKGTMEDFWRNIAPTVKALTIANLQPNTLTMGDIKEHGFPELEQLDLGNNPSLTRMESSFFKKMPLLESLYIDNCNFEAEHVMSILTNLPPLKYLDISFNPHLSGQLRNLSEKLGSLEDLCLGGIAQKKDSVGEEKGYSITQEDLETLSSLKNLKSLTICYSRIEADHMVSLRQLSLERLFLDAVEMDDPDRAIRILLNFPNLSSLALNNVALSDESAALLYAKFPRTEKAKKEQEESDEG